MTLEERQLELEIEMAGIGAAQYVSQAENDIAAGRGATTMSGTYLVKRALPPVTAAAQEYVKATTEGKVGRHPIAALILQKMDIETASYIAIRTILNCALQHADTIALTNLARAVGTSLELEARFAHFSKEAPALYNTVLKSTSGTMDHRTKVLQFAMGRFEIEWDKWTPTHQIQLGMRMIQLVEEQTNYISIIRGAELTGKHPDTYYVAIQPELSDWLAASIERGKDLHPRLLPMLIPPKPWGVAGDTGGYLSPTLSSFPFIRSGKASADHKEQQKVLRGAQLSSVYLAVNAIQETGWRVNRRVFEVQQQVHENSLPLGGFTPAGEIQLPPKPHDIDTNAEALTQWKRDARDTYTQNLSRRRSRLSQMMIMNTAERFAKEEQFFFPHSVDFRGRVYPIVPLFQPQASDPVKAVLEFSEGKPLGPTGARWLAIHGANVWGEDKVSFQERIDWVDKNTAMIEACAADPLTNKQWCEADKPWGFLAFCFEWADYLETGEETISHIPIALDGSCNGLQHFSAMLRDSVGGQAVNLIPSEKPQDIYQAVADEATRALEKFKTHGTEDEKRWAYEWLTFGLDRKITKRPVMVLPYGGTIVSCTEYVREAVADREGANPTLNIGDEYLLATQFLANTIWEAIGSVVVAARAAMGWLQRVATQVNKLDVPLIWTAPSGFRVYQWYPELKNRRIKTMLHGSMIKLTVYSETEKVLKSKQRLAISPNYVHSFDAAALTLTVWKLYGMGLVSFAMIHDSYGVHACDTDLLATTLRETFIDMYQINPLEHMRDELETRYPQLKGQLPPIPETGDLNLDEIINSEFFFA